MDGDDLWEMIDRSARSVTPWFPSADPGVMVVVLPPATQLPGSRAHRDGKAGHRRTALNDTPHHSAPRSVLGAGTPGTRNSD